MEAKLIDLSHYVRTGEGANGSSYNSLTDEGEMLKLYNSDYPKEFILTELDAARKVYDLGIPSPEPGELVTDGERFGIKFRRIPGKRSIARAVGDEPWRCEEFAREFAREFKKFHSVHCPEGQFQSVKDQYLEWLDDDKAFTDAEKSVIRDFILSVEDSDCALHGDMHFGNVLTTLPKGAPMSDPHDIVFIDLGAFTAGSRFFDFGMLYLCTVLNTEEFISENFHFSKEVAVKFWEYAADEYFFAGDALADKLLFPGATMEDIERKILPFAGLKAFLIENNSGLMIPAFEKVIRSTILGQ